MPRGPVFRLLCAAFILVMSGGGGEFPALDGLLYHSRGAVPVPVTSHFEADGGCHADQCTIRSTAQQPRLTPTVPVQAIRCAAPEAILAAFAPVDFRSQPSTTQPFSRAPPVLQV